MRASVAGWIAGHLVPANAWRSYAAAYVTGKVPASFSPLHDDDVDAHLECAHRGIHRANLVQQGHEFGRIAPKER